MDVIFIAFYDFLLCTFRLSIYNSFHLSLSLSCSIFLSKGIGCFIIEFPGNWSSIYLLLVIIFFHLFTCLFLFLHFCFRCYLQPSFIYLSSLRVSSLFFRRKGISSCFITVFCRLLVFRVIFYVN